MMYTLTWTDPGKLSMLLFLRPYFVDRLVAQKFDPGEACLVQDRRLAAGGVRVNGAGSAGWLPWDRSLGPALHLLSSPGSGLRATYDLPDAGLVANLVARVGLRPRPPRATQPQKRTQGHDA